MKPCIKSGLLLRLVITDFVVMAVGHLNAQTFKVLHTFDQSLNSPSGYDTNRDGAGPQGDLILSSNMLYGTAAAGGSSGMGTIFALNTNGTGFRILHSFTPPTTNNTDGVGPGSGLVISGNVLYGTASGGGGTGGSGTVFAINTDGTGFKTLYSFTALDYSTSIPTNTDGANPNGGLVLSGNTLYGTAYGGGAGGVGTVFALNTNGTGFKTLYSFTGANPNTDGGSPHGSFVISGTTLYGTTYSGGTGYAGTVFALNTDGTGFRTLHSFSPLDDGAYPSGGVVLSSNILYGTTPNWGGANGGTVFALNTDGSGFSTLYSFALSPGGTNSAGASPGGGLVVSSNFLCGATAFGGSSAGGTVFALNTYGTSFRSLHSFAGSDGGRPTGGLLVSGNTSYGAASLGGTGGGSGTVFSLSLPPPLTTIRSVTNIILTWPTNATGFTLQYTTNLVPPTTWTTVSPGPVVVNGQNTVTNPVSGTRRFYRLSQ